MDISGWEYETIINLNQQDEVAYIHTRIPKHYRHFERLGIKPTKVYKDNEGKEYGWDFTVPVSWVKMPKAPKKMSFTKEQRKKMGERLKKARKS